MGIVRALKRAADKKGAMALDSGLTEAARIGDVEWAKKLLEQGADVNVTHGGMPLMLLVAKNGRKDGWSVKMAECLIKAKARVSARSDLTGMTALMESAQSGDLAMVRLLLWAGASPWQKDNDGSTAVDYAVKGCLAKGSGEGCGDGIGGKAEHGAVMEMMLGESWPFGSDNKGWGASLLLDAVSSGSVEMARILLKAGVSTGYPAQRRAAAGSATIGYAYSALCVAAQRGDAEMTGALLKAGADPNEKGLAQPPLAIALNEGFDAVAGALLRHGAEFERLPVLRNPLDMALEKGMRVTVSELLSRESNTASVTTRLMASALVDDKVRVMGLLASTGWTNGSPNADLIAGMKRRAEEGGSLKVLEWLREECQESKEVAAYVKEAEAIEALKEAGEIEALKEAADKEWKAGGGAVLMAEGVFEFVVVRNGVSTIRLAVLGQGDGGSEGAVKERKADDWFIGKGSVGQDVFNELDTAAVGDLLRIGFRGGIPESVESMTRADLVLGVAGGTGGLGLLAARQSGGPSKKRM